MSTVFSLDLYEFGDFCSSRKRLAGERGGQLLTMHAGPPLIGLVEPMNLGNQAPMSGKLKCEGIVVPVVTPITGEGELDEQALRQAIDRILRAGVHGVFVLGTMGEGPSLPREMRDAAVRVAVEEVRGRVPIYAGVTHPNIADTVSEARRYRAAGADVLVTVCPYYMPISDREVLLYFERLIEATGGPLMLYDIPSMTKVTFSPDVVETLSRDSRVIGYKDSRNNAEALWGLIRRFEKRNDFSIFVGIESLVPEAVLYGAAGGVCGGANVWPELFVGVYEAARSRDLQALESLRAKLIEFVKLYPFGPSAGDMIGGVKAAMECLGIGTRYLLPPLISYDDQKVESVRTALKDFGLL